MFKLESATKTVFLNDADIQLIIEFKTSFGIYHPVCRNIP